jgi:hypothetical protein
MFFDPNQSQSLPPVNTSPEQFPFEQRQAAINERKRRLALAMKEGLLQQPQGRMVGGQLVNPHFLERLVPLAQQVVNQWEGADIAKEQGAFDAADRKAAIEHAMNRPQETPELQGPQAEQGSPELAATQPTQQQMAEWAQKGMAIPSRRDVVSKIMTDLEVNAPIRKEAKEERRLDREDRQKEAQATLAANLELKREQLEQRAEDARLRSEDRRLDREARADAERERRAIQRELTGMRLDAAKEAADKKAAITKEPKTTEGEKSSAGYLNRMQKAEELLGGIKGGELGPVEKAIGAIPGVGKDVQPYVLNKNQQKALQAQRDWVRAKLRKESGASISPAEEAEEIRTYFPQPGEDPETIEQKRQSRKEAMRQLEIGAGPAAGPAAGPKVRKFNPATGRLE